MNDAAPDGPANAGRKTMTSNEINVVKAFIAAINRRNLSEISDLMTEDHTFVDSAAESSQGART